MHISHAYGAAVAATDAIDSTLQKPRSLVRDRLLRLGSAIVTCTLVMGATGAARAGDTRDEAAVRALGDAFAKAFVQKNADLRASLFAEDGTFVTPVGHLLQGRVEMVKDFGPEAQQAVNGTTQAAFSNYRVRFIKPDVAVVDALLTVRNASGSDGTIIPAIPIDFFYVAVRRGDHWLIEDGRAHFSAAPPSGMSSGK